MSRESWKFVEQIRDLAVHLGVAACMIVIAGVASGSLSLTTNAPRAEHGVNDATHARDCLVCRFSRSQHAALSRRNVVQDVTTGRLDASWIQSPGREPPREPGECRHGELGSIAHDWPRGNGA